MNMSETAVLPVDDDARLRLAADRLADSGEAARRDAGEHPVHHRPRQRIAVGKVSVGVDGQLALVVCGAHPRPTHRNAPPAQRHRPILMAVTLGDATGVVLALGPDDLVDLERHQLMHDTEPDTDAEREQSLPRCADQLTKRLQDLRWQRTLRRLEGRDDLGGRYLPHGGSSCPQWTSTPRTLATRADEAGGPPPFNFSRSPANSRRLPRGHLP